MTLALIHSALATAAWAMFILVAIAAAVAFREEAVYAWRHRGWRNEREDSDYDALRTEGMGDPSSVPLDPEAPCYSELADLRPEAVASLDEARLRRRTS